MQALAININPAPEVVAGREGTGNGVSISRAKGRRPKKLEHDVDYASFPQRGNSWNLQKISN